MLTFVHGISGYWLKCYVQKEFLFDTVVVYNYIVVQMGNYDV